LAVVVVVQASTGGGHSTGPAMNVLNRHVAALPPNVFGTWMNISGSLLAKWWHWNPPRGDATGESDA
jgi:BASS family bile acid:Na+ symporter